MARRKKESASQLHGVLVLNKPSGPTSAGCLNVIKRKLDQPKIGHAGTLDPLASGVLVVLLGRATKIANYLSGQTKVYTGELELGKSTDTYDIEGEILQELSVEASEDDVRNEISSWTDLTEQEVPAYSAAKHKGKPLYALAREGKEVPVKVKPVTIYAAEPLEVNLPGASFKVGCSAGTYIRSLVHSLGKRLGCGAVLTKLTRVASEPFGLEQAVGLDELLDEPERFPERVIPLEKALPHWRRIQLPSALSELVRNGGRLPVSASEGQLLSGTEGEQAFFVDDEGKALSLSEVKKTDKGLEWAIIRGLWS